MEKRALGTSGLEISVVGYGAWEAGGAQWGASVEDEQVLEAMHAAIDAGINWIDTAEAYGDGRSEELVGKVARERREEMLVFTKVAPFATGTRPEEVRKAVTGSLQRLGIDTIDLYQIHWPDEERVPVEDTWGAMTELKQEGLVRAVGVSNFDRSLVERCLAVGGVDSVQNQLSLLHMEDADDMLPWLSANGIGYLAYGPLAFGLLTGKIDRDTTFDDDDWRSGKKEKLGYYQDLFAPGKIERSLAVVERLRPIAEREQIDLPMLALRAVLEFEGVTGVIAGSRKAPHVRENAGAGEMRLTEEALADIRAALGS